jgi:hypothetical protein
VDRKKYTEYLDKRDDRRVKGHFHHLGMASIPATDLSVGGIYHPTVAVSRHDVSDTLQIIKNRLEAPETTTAESDNLQRIFYIYHLASFFKDFGLKWMSP